MSKGKGFTLVELAIVLTIIGILLGTILIKSGVIVSSAKATDTIALVKDLSAAITEFKGRYHYLPGDMPMAGDNISSISAACNIATSTANIGNGKIDTVAEVGCVAEHLVRAGLVKGDVSGIYTISNASGTPDVLVTASRTSGLNLFPSSVVNEIQLLNQPCETAQAVDTKMDDGNFATGRILASVSTCTTGSIVPFLDIAL